MPKRKSAFNLESCVKFSMLLNIIVIIIIIITGRSSPGTGSSS